MYRIWIVTAAALCVLTGGVRTQAPVVLAAPNPGEFSGIQVPEGFRVELYADDDLAHDIHSLTIDTQGRVVVSGPGYIRILIDSDNSGRADSYIQFADLPKTGSQGMFWHGSSLLCSGDEGLLLFRDEDRDGRADGPPQVFLKIAAGGEHHVHSIQQGPDGWWYVIAGNFAGVNEAYATLPTSPLRSPQNGVLFRLRPDLQGGEILSDGMRNAYDFAFNEQGDVFTYDSDDERDISLPWYLPTRVFHLLPMSHAGWVSTGWKRPDRFADMPPVIASFGRGSPTGVVCYRHLQFPEPYHGALFVLDWTLGRIHTLPMQQDGSGWSSRPQLFAAGRNQFGFAPTDLEVGPDGSLYVSVGGRGTRGSVYRISCDAGSNDVQSQDADSVVEHLDRVLRSPQPLSSWSRAVWMPIARRLGAGVFRKAATDETRPASDRLRAIEILVEQFDGLDSETAGRLTMSGSASVRARAAWAIGRTGPGQPDPRTLRPLLHDRDPMVQRFALEAIAGVTAAEFREPFLQGIGMALDADEREVRLTAAHLISRMPQQQRKQLAVGLSGQTRAMLWMHLGTQLRSPAISLPAVRFSMSIVGNSQHPIELRREAARVLLLALGDVGPAEGRPPLFDSYLPRQSLAPADRELDPLRAALAEVFPSGDTELDHELIRVISMTSPLNRNLLTRLLAEITEDSLPSDDIHRLAAISQFPLERSFEESTVTARSLISIDVKIRQLGLKQDRHWDDRMGELFTMLRTVDPVIPALLAGQPGFGQPGHTLYMAQVPQSSLQKAINGFVATILTDDQFRWTNDVVFVLGESTNPEHHQLLREQLENLSIRDALLMVLAERPARDDRELFLSGLDSVQLNAVEACVKALTRLPPSVEAAEQFQLLSTARRLIADEREFRIRETIIRLLENNTGQAAGFEFGPDGHRPQPDAMRRWQQILTKRYPDYQAVTQGDAAARIWKLLTEVDWNAGDTTRGEKLFERLSCLKCHGGRQALGPDLIGAARRFSRDDLFAAIIEPDRDVSPRYQTTTVVTTSGRMYTGMIVYESVDGLLLRDSDHRTYRIEAGDIESRHIRRTSLMPAGLLKDADAQALADLYRYMQTL